MLSLTTSYGRQDFWEERYQKEKEQFDWFQRFNPPTGNSPWRDLILDLVKDQAKQGQIFDHFKDSYQVLNVGCGISRLAEEMWDEGFHAVTSIDFSYSAIKFQQDFYRQEYPKLIFKYMDVRKLEYNDASFDMVIDKAVLDAVICSDGSKTNVTSMLTEIYRVLKPGGYYICLSHGKEIQRSNYFAPYKFEMACHKIHKPEIGISFKPKDHPKADIEKQKFHFCYVLKKVDQLSAMSQMAGPAINSPIKENAKPSQREIARQPSLNGGRARSVKSNNSQGSQYTPKQGM